MRIEVDIEIKAPDLTSLLEHLKVLHVYPPQADVEPVAPKEEKDEEKPIETEPDLSKPEPEEAKQETPPWEEQKQEVPAAEGATAEYSAEDVRQALISVKKVKGSSSVKQLLNSFGADKFSELTEDQFARVIAGAKEMIG